MQTIKLLIELIRKWLSMRFINIAIRLWPDNPKVKEFYLQRAIDYAITGKHIIRIDPDLIYKGKESNV